MIRFALPLALITICAPALAQTRVVDAPSGPIRVETVAHGLEHPWGLAFLPDGRMVVTERPGRLRIVAQDGTVSPPVDGVPRVFAEGQGGLLDIAPHPQFATNRLVYMTFSEPGAGGASTALARGRLEDGRLEEVTVLFSQTPKVDGGHHFGSRVVFAPDGTLFVTMGDRGKQEPAQDLTNHIGTIARLRDDGSVPPDNPFVGRSDALPEIWSYGHRNIQGAAIHPDTGALWEVEHGPRGGDEVNVPEKGKNYGWPLVSWGRHYSGWPISDPTTRPDLVGSIYQWTPVIAVSGMDFYTADRFPGWKGSALVGGLVSQGVVRLALDGQTVTDEERITLDARVRQVRQGPDGAVYVITDEDDGAILRLTPAER
ncbi:PQQ-dependent sugar dehydrogenase [Novispirillum sp. DQ9]|uniref:PQQ-dependent sugar dehydrogenase n=1 Tax=Novispirillum sp. DQ9 TaxID=3398612 RepID=UPI003C7E4B4E